MHHPRQFRRRSGGRAHLKRLSADDGSLGITSSDGSGSFGDGGGVIVPAGNGGNNVVGAPVTITQTVIRSGTTLISATKTSTDTASTASTTARSGTGTSTLTSSASRSTSSSSSSTASTTSSSSSLSSFSSSPTFLSPTPTPTSTLTGSTDANNETSSQNSSGDGTTKRVPIAAIGATVGVVVLALIALIIFLLRRHFRKQRARKRISWGADALAFTTPPPAAAVSEKPTYDTAGSPPFIRIQLNDQSIPPNAPVSYLNMSRTPSPAVDPAYGRPAGSTYSRSPPIPSPPPVTSAYQNPALAPVPPALMPGPSSSPRPMGRAVTVLCSFVPTLPDEMNVNPGETVRILSEYDDGWAMCANNLGGRGMVPVACLNRGREQPQLYANPIQNQAELRGVQRSTSLRGRG